MIAPENDSDKSPFYAGGTTQVGGASKTDSTITIVSVDDDFAANSDIVETIGNSWGSTSKYFHWMDGTIDRVTYSNGTTLTVKETITGDPGDKNNSGFKSGGILTSMRNFDSQGYFYCNLVGNSVDFQYTTTMKDNGYSGSLNFQEI